MQRLVGRHSLCLHDTISQQNFPPSISPCLTDSLTHAQSQVDGLVLLGGISQVQVGDAMLSSEYKRG